jgi:peroxiredoxin
MMKKPMWARAKTAFALIAGVMLMTAGSALAIGKVGDMAADWSGLKDLDGKTCNLADYKGKVLLIMTVQWNCGGCNANAPRVGQIAKQFAGKNFQALGPDINHGSVANLRTFEKNLKKIATDVNFPLLTGLTEPAIVNTDTGTKWAPYNALRDVFFIIDHTGKIVGRVDGNRGNTMGEANYKKVEDAITAALANVPTTAITVSGGADLCLRACKRAGNYQIDLAPKGKPLSGNVTLRILDPQGRVIRNLDWNGGAGSQASGAGSQAIWDGMDSQGHSVAWGSYFLNATAPGSSVTMLLSWLP